MVYGQGLDSIVLCLVSLLANNIPNIVACVDMSSNFVDSLIWYATTMLGFYGFTYIHFAVGGLLVHSGV